MSWSDYVNEYDSGEWDRDRAELEQQPAKKVRGGLNGLIEECSGRFYGPDGTARCNGSSNLVFSSSKDFREDNRSYVYPCMNHWRGYQQESFKFECVIVGKDRIKIMPGTWIDKWEVKGSSGDLWTVSKKLDNSFGCSCPGWKFKKAPKPDCKHIRAIKTAMNAGIVPASKLKSENLERIAARLREAYLPGYDSLNIPGEDLTAEVDHEFFQVKRKFRLDD